MSVAVRESRLAAPTVDEQTSIGPYRLVEQIGRGTYGTVYGGYPRDAPARKLAIKVIEDQGNIDRLLMEPTILRQLQHPNIIRLSDFLFDRGRLVLVLEYVDGSDLQRLLREGARFSPQQVRELLVQLARALEAAHGNNIVHCDIKPSNILVDRGGERPRYVLTDFGISRIAATLQTTPHVAGTYLYMAPEQLRGRFTPQTDLWALGVVAYQLLTGTHPFLGNTVEEVRRNISFADPVTPGQVVAHDDPELDAIIHTLLEKLPSDRYDSAQALLSALSAKPQARPPAPADALALSSWEQQARSRIQKNRRRARTFFWWAATLDFFVPPLLAYLGVEMLRKAEVQQRSWLRWAALLVLLASIVSEKALNQLQQGYILDVTRASAKTAEVTDPQRAISCLLFTMGIGCMVCFWLAGKNYAAARRGEQKLSLQQSLWNALGSEEENLLNVKQIVDIEPEDITSHLRYVEMLRNRNRHEEALIECLLITDRDPYNLDALYHCAETYCELGLPARCIAVCENVLLFSPYSFEFAEIKARVAGAVLPSGPDTLNAAATERRR